METILKSNDLVYVSWVKSLLASNSINFFVLDEEMSVMEGNITAIPVKFWLIMQMHRGQYILLKLKKRN